LYQIGGTDLEHAFFIEKQLVFVRFRGTCATIDLTTDVNIGFRNSMNSNRRRLKELILATVAPGESISDNDMLVTGHSLGGTFNLFGDSVYCGYWRIWQ
jgi:hypothetical protein